MKRQTTADQHGTTTGYAYGCRCNACRGARSKWKREYLKRNPQKRPNYSSGTPTNPRYEEMCHLRFVELWTLDEIADKFGVVRERVRQIIGTTGSGYKARRITEAVQLHPELTNGKLAELMGCSDRTISDKRRGQRHAIDGGFPQRGAEIENAVSQELKERGIEHKLMPHQHKFDILLSNGLRVDVKSSLPKACITKITPMYSWRTDQDKRGNYADFFIFVTADTKEMFVVPACKTRPITPVRFAYPPANHGKKSKWHQYHDAFHLLTLPVSDPRGRRAA